MKKKNSKSMLPTAIVVGAVVVPIGLFVWRDLAAHSAPTKPTAGQRPSTATSPDIISSKPADAKPTDGKPAPAPKIAADEADALRAEIKKLVERVSVLEAKVNRPPGLAWPQAEVAAELAESAALPAPRVAEPTIAATPKTTNTEPANPTTSPSPATAVTSMANAFAPVVSSPPQQAQSAPVANAAAIQNDTTNAGNSAANAVAVNDGVDTNPKPTSTAAPRVASKPTAGRNSKSAAAKADDTTPQVAALLGDPKAAEEFDVPAAKPLPETFLGGGSLNPALKLALGVDPQAAEKSDDIVNIVLLSPQDGGNVGQVVDLVAQTDVAGYPVVLVRADNDDEYWWVQHFVARRNQYIAARAHFGNNDSFPGSPYALTILMLDSAEEAVRFRAARQFKELPKGIPRSKVFHFVRQQ